MRKSISYRFSSAMRILIMASIGVLGLFFRFFANRYLQTDRISTLNLCVRNAQSAYEESLRDSGDMSTEEKRGQLRDNLRLITNTTSTKMLLADENGKILVCTELGGCAHEGNFVPEDMMKTLYTQNDVGIINDTFANMYDSAYYTVGSAARDGSGNIVGYIFAYSDADRTTTFISALMTIFIIGALPMILLASIMAIILSGHLTTPLSNITKVAQAFSQGDFSARVKVEGDDEIAHLAATFNDMAGFVEKNEKSRSSFVANIAHELRTPMTSIKGFVDGIIDGTIPPELQGRYLNVISDEVGRLARLTNSMLDISKLESGEFNMNPQNYNVWDTIAAVAFAFENRIEENKIVLSGFAPSKIMVNADPDIVHQIVYNIFDNALKFTPVGGTIGFDVRLEENTGFAVVKIRNSGDGINRESLPYIFERFYKEDTSRSVHVKGAGIGLFIVKTLVQRSGGVITVDSDGETFTEFSFTLPQAKQQKTVILPALTEPEIVKNIRPKVKKKKK